MAEREMDRKGVVDSEGKLHLFESKKEASLQFPSGTPGLHTFSFVGLISETASSKIVKSNDAQTAGHVDMGCSAENLRDFAGEFGHLWDGERIEQVEHAANVIDHLVGLCRDFWQARRRGAYGPEQVRLIIEKYPWLE